MNMTRVMLEARGIRSYEYKFWAKELIYISLKELSEA